MKAKSKIMLSAALALAMAAPATAQEQAPPDEEQLQELVTEARHIQQHLASVQQQALASPEIARQREELSALIEEAISEQDPALENDLASAHDLEPQMAEAEAAGDQERLQELIEEVRALEARVAEAQRVALQDPELSSIVLAFNEQVEERILEIEPHARQMIERLQEIQSTLQAAVR